MLVKLVWEGFHYDFGCYHCNSTLHTHYTLPNSMANTSINHSVGYEFWQLKEEKLVNFVVTLLDKLQTEFLLAYDKGERPPLSIGQPHRQ